MRVFIYNPQGTKFSEYSVPLMDMSTFKNDLQRRLMDLFPNSTIHNIDHWEKEIHIDDDVFTYTTVNE